MDKTEKIILIGLVFFIGMISGVLTQKIIDVNLNGILIIYLVGGLVSFITMMYHRKNEIHNELLYNKMELSIKNTMDLYFKRRNGRLHSLLFLSLSWVGVALSTGAVLEERRSLIKRKRDLERSDEQKDPFIKAFMKTLEEEEEK